MVNKKDAKEFITGESAPNSDNDDDDQTYSATIFKGTGASMIEDTENDPVTTLGELMNNKALPPNKSNKKKRKTCNASYSDIADFNDDYLANLSNKMNWWRT